MNCTEVKQICLYNTFLFNITIPPPQRITVSHSKEGAKTHPPPKLTNIVIFIIFVLLLYCELCPKKLQEVILFTKSRKRQLCHVWKSSRLYYIVLLFMITNFQTDRNSLIYQHYKIIGTTCDVKRR